MQGSDPFYFHFIFMFFILKGASAPPFYLGTPDGGQLDRVTYGLLFDAQVLKTELLLGRARRVAKHCNFTASFDSFSVICS